MKLKKSKLNGIVYDGEKNLTNTNKVGYLDVSKIVYTYFKEIWRCYDMSYDRENFLDVRNFIKEFSSLSENEFIKYVKEFYECEQMFTNIYYLIKGDIEGVKILLSNNGMDIKSEHINKYVLEMQKRATSRLETIINKLDKFPQQEKKANDSINQSSKELLNYKNVKAKSSKNYNKENLVTQKLDNKKHDLKLNNKRKLYKT